VQTPNRFFPIEPHFLFPGFQFLPQFLKRWLARIWPYGWSAPGSPQAMRDAEDIHLLTVRQMSRLFPDAYIIGERVGPLVKSLIATRTDGTIDLPSPFILLAKPSLPCACPVK